MPSTAEVKAYFEDAGKYFGADECNTSIMQRQRIVRAFIEAARTNEPCSMLDIACGNGLISLPLCRPSDRLTLVDISAEMVQRAKNHAASMNATNVDFILHDFMRCQLPESHYDCVLAMGILAHVPSPEMFIDRIVNVVPRGGHLIIELTDAAHFWRRLHKRLSRRTYVCHDNSYALNEVTSSTLLKWMSDRNFNCVGQYRYELKIPVIGRFLSKNQQLACAAFVFGTPPSNRIGWIGSKCIFMFRRT
jgi:2-polyprenyl-3-methyl-5-hydroxy-6-metoxy-1,4-benzoquinol methylase